MKLVLVSGKEKPDVSPKGVGAKCPLGSTQSKESDLWEDSAKYCTEYTQIGSGKSSGKPDLRAT